MFKIWMHLIYMKDLNCHHLYWEKQMPSSLQSHIFLIFNQFEDMPQISNIKENLICWLGLQNKLYFLFLRFYFLSKNKHYDVSSPFTPFELMSAY